MKLIGDTRAKFLKGLSEGLTRRKACKKVGIAPSTLYREIGIDPTLKQEIEDAEEEATDEVENALWEAATSGHALSMFFWLQNRRPDRWQDRRNQFTPPKDNTAERQQAIKEAYDQLSDHARELLEEDDRRRLEDEYRREVRGGVEQSPMEAGEALDEDRPADQ